MKLKKILAGALAAVVAVGSLSVGAFAETDASGNFQYEVLEDGTVSIIQYNFNAANAVIPDTIDGKPVTTIGEKAFYSSLGYKLISIDIPDTVTKIEDRAFEACSSITEIALPDSLTYIGEYAFLNCNSLEKIVIPAGVTTIEDYTFQQCYALTDVTLPGTLTTIKQGAFGFCTSLAEIVIPDSVTTINRSIFYSCESLEKVVLPKGLTSIPAYTFNGCTSLKEVVFPDSVTTIEECAFYTCTSLTEIVIPDSVTTIGESAFGQCYSLTDVAIPDSVTTIGGGAFAYCESLEKIVIPNRVTAIGNSTFARCTSLTEVVIPAGVTTIDETAFRWHSDDLIIYGYEGSYAETYAKENGINFVALDKESTDSNNPSKEDTSLEDKETGIAVSAAEGVIPEGVTLTVKADNENSDPSSVAYDITITADDGKPADINGNVTVSIPVPEELAGADTYYVFYQAADGTLTDMKATFKDGVITFTTTHFSTYIVSTVDLLEDKTTPNSGIEGVAIVAGIAAVAAAGVIISKKRR